MLPHTLFCTARAESTFGTMTMCNLGDSRMHYRRSCPQRFVNPMFPRLATLIIHRKIGQCLFSNGICFSPQPPEGGCMSVPLMMQMLFGFQLTAARRRLPVTPPRQPYTARFNSQPPEGDYQDTCYAAILTFSVSTHSRSKAAAKSGDNLPQNSKVSTHSRSKAAAAAAQARLAADIKFQLTAARRRLRATNLVDNRRGVVSTHSRPKAAART